MTIGLLRGEDVADAGGELDVLARRARAPGSAQAVAVQARGRVIDRPQAVAAVAAGVIGQPLPGEELRPSERASSAGGSAAPAAGRAGPGRASESIEVPGRRPAASATDRGASGGPAAGGSPSSRGGRGARRSTGRLGGRSGSGTGPRSAVATLRIAAGSPDA